MTKAVRIITGILGVLMFMAGANKLFEPSKTNLMIQVVNSGLPFTQFTYWLTIVGEITIGSTLMVTSFASSKLNQNLRDGFFYVASLGVVVMMLVAIYVHIQPEVPAEALPGKKPFLPIAFIIIVAINTLLKRKSEQIA